MTSFAEVPLSTFFSFKGGQAKFIRDYIDSHPGEFPVYSASLLGPFGFVDEFQYEGRYLTWVMNGYGGRVQEIEGRFSTNRDRGIFLPRDNIETPDLTYVRSVAEPILTASAVGRRVDGRANDYTKIYPPDAQEIQIPVPLTSAGQYDYERMSALGERYRRVEQAQRRVFASAETISRATFPLEIEAPVKTVSLGEADFFELSIGERVLIKDHVESGIPVYSANARQPFGEIGVSNLTDFSRPSLLWGIDGIFDWSLVDKDVEFATTDHCGRLQILDDDIDPEYVLYYLRATRARYGFDRVYRASLGNVRLTVTVEIPCHADLAFDRERQQEIAKQMRVREGAKEAVISLLGEVCRARVAAD